MFSERVPSGVRAIEPRTCHAPAFALPAPEAYPKCAENDLPVYLRRPIPCARSACPWQTRSMKRYGGRGLCFSRPRNGMFALFDAVSADSVPAASACGLSSPTTVRLFVLWNAFQERRGFSRLRIPSPLAMTPNGIFGVGRLNDFLVEASFQASVQCTSSVLSIRARLVCPSVSQSSKYQEVEVAATGRHRDPAASQQPELTSRKQVQATTSLSHVRHVPPRLPLESAPEWPLHQTPAFVRNLHRVPTYPEHPIQVCLQSRKCGVPAQMLSGHPLYVPQRFLNLDVAAQSGKPAPFPARYTDPASIRCALSMRGCEYPRLRSAARVQGQPRHDWHSSWGGDGDSGRSSFALPCGDLARWSGSRAGMRGQRVSRRSDADASTMAGCQGVISDSVRTDVRQQAMDYQLLPAPTPFYELLRECYKLLQAAMRLLPHATWLLRECYKLLRLSMGCYELLRQSYELLRAATSSYGALQPLRHSYEPLPCFYWVLWQLYELLRCNPNPTTRRYALLCECYAVATRLLRECYAAATRLLWSAPEIGTSATTLRALRGPTGAPERAQGLLM
ncbi:hypothetical protein B0H17DRAFT_1199106 [Mycena rosella]|uniref:Uncharacterized protein n=1 Tax=Mycena rosella TaxID=1033263 RepID=A0AAD7GK31_MYCRO|nr:hypothetical protein B0H17DRAFT_1199106 [Mycena rosella]